MRHNFMLVALLAAIALSACGTKGPLTQTPKPATPASNLNDLNTAKEPAR